MKLGWLQSKEFDDNNDDDCGGGGGSFELFIFWSWEEADDDDDEGEVLQWSVRFVVVSSLSCLFVDSYSKVSHLMLLSRSLSPS